MKNKQKISPCLCIMCNKIINKTAIKTISIDDNDPILHIKYIRNKYKDLYITSASYFLIKMIIDNSANTKDSYPGHLAYKSICSECLNRIKDNDRW